MATEPIPSLHTKLHKAHSWVTLVIGSTFSVVLFGFQAAQFLATLATKENLDNTRKYLVSENVKLKSEIDEIKTVNASLLASQREIKEVLTSHLELHAGRLAAEHQTDKRKAAKAAEEARLKFREALAEGKTLEQALVSTWY
jgi:biopolymer transport protein ExbB/TolQ